MADPEKTVGTSAEEKKVPQAVTAGSTEGSNIVVGEHNDSTRRVIMKQSYVGTPDRDFRYSIDESMLSIAYTEDTGYIEEYLTGSVQPSKYWEKKLLGYRKRDVSVLSFSDMPFTLATGITFRVPGGDLDGTIRGSFRFVRGNPRSIASLLESTYAEESTNYNVRRKYLTAEGLEKIIRSAFQDIVRGPLFKDRIYSDLDELQDLVRERINDTPFFAERSIEVSEVSIRADRTSIEKLEDEETRHRILMREIAMEREARTEAVEIARSEAEAFKDI